MPNFQIAIEKPEEIIPRLGRPELHWKEGRSAFELSTGWMHAGGIPRSVQSVLDQAPEWREAKLLDATFERETALPGQGRPSQTDLLGIVSLKDGNAILGVEGKADEPFGELVSEWLKGEPKKRPGEEPAAQAQRERSKANRKKRLTALCEVLDVDRREVLDVDRRGVSNLYYQLFHRTCAAIYEAKRLGYRRAVMLVHSYAEPSGPSNLPACFEEFRVFASTVGMPVRSPNSISSTKSCGGIELRLAWVSDKVSTSQKPIHLHRIMNDFHRCKYFNPDIKTIAFAQARQLPPDNGVYAIWQGERCIYVGQAGQEPGIRDRFRHHVNNASGQFDTGTKDTAGWCNGRSQTWWNPATWEVEYVLCSSRLQRSYLEGAMLLEFKPCCNDELFLEDR